MDVYIPLLSVLALVLKPLVGICGADLSCTLHCENVLAHTEAKCHWRRLHSPTPSSVEKCMFCFVLFFFNMVGCFDFALGEQPLHRDTSCPRGSLCSGGNGRAFLPGWHKASCCPDWRVGTSLLLAAPLPQGSSLVTQREHRSPCFLDNRRLQS